MSELRQCPTPRSIHVVCRSDQRNAAVSPMNTFEVEPKICGANVATKFTNGHLVRLAIRNPPSVYLKEKTLLVFFGRLNSHIKASQKPKLGDTPRFGVGCGNHVQTRQGPAGRTGPSPRTIFWTERGKGPGLAEARP